MNYGAVPVVTKCPQCKQEGATILRREVGVSTWLVCMALTLFCLVPCNYCPFCLPQCKDITHHCPVCGLSLGKKSLFG